MHEGQLFREVVFAKGVGKERSRGAGNWGPYRVPAALRPHGDRRIEVNRYSAVAFESHAELLWMSAFRINRGLEPPGLIAAAVRAPLNGEVENSQKSAVVEVHIAPKRIAIELRPTRNERSRLIASRL